YDVEFVAAARPVLDLPQHAGLRMEGGALGIADAVGPDLPPRPGAIDKGVVVRHGAIGVDSNDLAEMAAQILRRIEFEALARGDEQRAIPCEDQSRAEVIRPADLGLLPEYDLDAFEPRAGHIEAAARDRRRRAAIAGLGIGQ